MYVYIYIYIYIFASKPNQLSASARNCFADSASMSASRCA